MSLIAASGIASRSMLEPISNSIFNQSQVISELDSRILFFSPFASYEASKNA
jgi:hypothetical protein